MALLLANKQQLVTKFVSGHLAHGKNMQQWKFCSSDQCPWFPEILETKLHVLRCRKMVAQCIWMSTLADLTKWLKTQNTDPQITQQLLMALKHWYMEAPWPTEGNPLLEAHNQIGQDWFMDRWLSWQWRTMQEAYWAQIWSRESSKQWLKEIWKSCGILGNTATMHYTTGDNNNILEADVNQAIWNVYLWGRSVLTSTTLPLLHHSLDECLSLPMATKQQWHESIEAAVKRERMGLTQPNSALWPHGWYIISKWKQLFIIYKYQGWSCREDSLTKVVWQD